MVHDYQKDKDKLRERQYAPANSQNIKDLFPRSFSTGGTALVESTSTDTDVVHINGDGNDDVAANNVNQHSTN